MELGATLPVATDWATTFSRVAVAVRYCVAAVEPRLGPITANAMAPTPTTMRPITARMRSFMRLPLCKRTGGAGTARSCAPVRGLDVG